MIRFFRKFRQRLLKEGKVYKYLLYAIGEILLVVIGILIALSLNNANDQRKKAEREKALLKELVSNLETNIVNLQSDIRYQSRSVTSIDMLIQHMIQKKPYTDSLSRLLHRADYAPDVILTSSSYETLKSSGLDLIRRDSLRQEIVHLFEVAYPMLMQETKRLEDQVWPTLVMPLYQKHIRFTDGKWHPVDYQTWVNDQEFINMLSRRRAMRMGSTRQKEKAVIATQKLIDLTNSELNERRE